MHFTFYFWLFIGTSAGFVAGVCVRIVLDCFALSREAPAPDSPRGAALRSSRCGARRAGAQMTGGMRIRGAKYS